MAADLATISTLTHYHKRGPARKRLNSSTLRTFCTPTNTSRIAQKLPNSIRWCYQRGRSNPYERLPSEDSVYQTKEEERESDTKSQWIQDWINRSTPNHFAEKEVKGNDEEFGQRVIVQVFAKDILLKSEIKEMLPGETITLLFEDANQKKKNAAQAKPNSSSILVPRTNNLNLQQTKQLERGLSIHCSKQKAFIWCPSGRACFVGDRKDWRDISLNTTWEEVQCGLDNVEPCPTAEEETAALEHNSATSCEDNVARVTIGCQPQIRIYDTDFHVKLSFWSKRRH